MKKKSSGFSLIEILTVIAIIAILAGILYPVFAQAKKSAINATNFSNIGQINKGFHHYTQDWDKMTPPANMVIGTPADLITHRIPHYNALLVPYLPRAWETWYDPFRKEICEGYGPGGNEPGNKTCHGYGLNIGIHAADGRSWLDKKDGLYDRPVGPYQVSSTAWITLYPGRTTEYYEKPDEFVVHQTSNDAPWWRSTTGASEWITNAIEYQNCPGGIDVQDFELPVRASGRWVVGLLSGAAKMVPHERYRALGYSHLIMPVKESDFLQRCNDPKDTVGGPAPRTSCQDRIREFIRNRTKF